MRTSWLAILVTSGCVSSVNPDLGRFSCASADDCGGGWECHAQVDGGGRCFKAGTCQAVEVCNGVDDTCNGAIDEGFDLKTDSLNCGACGHPCGAGTACEASVCRESQCDDGVDNDSNGSMDCADDACLGRTCASDGGVCAFRALDGGFDGGDGPRCR